jgi:hypothetical protein
MVIAAMGDGFSIAAATLSPLVTVKLPADALCLLNTPDPRLFVVSRRIRSEPDTCNEDCVHAVWSADDFWYGTAMRADRSH